MKIKCEYCDSLFDSTLEICPHCGGAASEHPIAQSEPITTPLSAKDDKRIRDAQLENMRLQNEKDRADTEQKAREQAETISSMLSNQVEELKGQLVQLKRQISELTKRAEQAEITSSKLSDDLTQLNSAYSDIQRALSDEQASHKKELAAAEKERETAVKYAIADTAGKYQRKIDEMQLKIDDMQTKQAEQIQAFSQILMSDNTEHN